MTQYKSYEDLGMQQEGHKTYQQPTQKLDNSMDAMMAMDIENSMNTQTHIDIDDVCMQVTSAMQWQQQPMKQQVVFH